MAFLPSALSMQSVVAAAALSLLVGLGLGGWVGHELAAGAAARADLAAATEAVGEASRTLGAARDQLKTTTERVAKSAARDAETASRHLTEAARYEQVISAAARLDCIRDADAFGLLVDAVRRANRHDTPAGAAAGMPQGLRLDAGALGPQRGGNDALGAAGGAVGRTLPDDQPRVPQGAGAVTGR